MRAHFWHFVPSVTFSFSGNIGGETGTVLASP